MIDNRFSLQNFKDKENNLIEIEKLNSLLEAEIQSELHTIIRKRLEEMVAELNLLGHQLTFYYPPRPGDISYSDYSTGKCLLRVGCDTVISIGFSDVDE